MRKISQYKILLRTRGEYYREFTRKVLTFRRSKWFKIKKILKRQLIEEKKTRQRLKKINRRKLKRLKKWDRLKRLKKFKKLNRIKLMSRLYELLRLKKIKELKKKKIFIKKPKYVHFVDFEKLAVERKRLVWGTTHYRLRRKVHFLLGQMYDQSLNKKELAVFLKKEGFLNRNYIFKKLFLRTEHRLDIFLWRLSFFHNIYECRKALTGGKILVNGRNLGWNTFLKKGDIIQVNSIFNAKLIRAKTCSLSYFNSFVEVDYYTGLIVVLKNLDEINPNDLSLFVPKRLNIDGIYKSVLR